MPHDCPQPDTAPATAGTSTAAGASAVRGVIAGDDARGGKSPLAQPHSHPAPALGGTSPVHAGHAGYAHQQCLYRQQSHTGVGHDLLVHATSAGHAPLPFSSAPATREHSEEGQVLAQL